MPNKKGETSVFRIDDLSDSETWRIGKDVVLAAVAMNHNKRTLYGRGDIQVDDIFNVGLSVVPSPEPHPKHADIVKWPEDKIERKTLATHLADRTIFLPFPG